MKLFGEYLIEKKVINSEGLATALVEQVRSIPPACDIAFRLNLLNPDQMLAVFRYQQDHRVDFIMAGKNFDFWTPELEKKIQSEVDKARMPLGQILVKKGMTDLPTLTKMLDEFLSTVEAPAPAGASKSAEPQAAATNSSGASLDPLLLAELETGFNETKYEELVNILQLVEQNVEVNELVEEFLSDFSKNIHSLKGMSKFLKLGVLENLFTNIEQTTNKILDKSISDISGKARKVSKIHSGFTLSWEIRNALVKSEAESVYSEKVNSAISSLLE